MNAEQLWDGFCAPPDEARPRAWWHWMDGNVDPEGIRLDLEWLHRVGVRSVQCGKTFEPVAAVYGSRPVRPERP